MPSRPRVFRPHAAHAASASAPTAPAHTGEGPRLYNTAEWKRLRKAQLQAEPCCCMCNDDEGRTERATIVDHKIPHRGDRVLFFDAGNLQSLCKPHHDGKKQSLEKGGTGGVRKRRVGVDGLPLP